MMSGRSTSVRTSALLPESRHFQLRVLAAANHAATSSIVCQTMTRFLSRNDGLTGPRLMAERGQTDG